MTLAMIRKKYLSNTSKNVMRKRGTKRKNKKKTKGIFLFLYILKRDDFVFSFNF